MNDSNQISASTGHVVPAAMHRKIPALVKIGYGAPGYASLFTFTLLLTYGMYFFTDVVGFSASFAGLLLGIGTIWDAITDPLVGMWSDKRDPIKGRRRPFMIGIAVPFGIISCLLFTDFGFEPTLNAVYFAVMVILFYTVQTILDIPYTGLGSEMTYDYNERSGISASRLFWAILGAIVSGATFSLVGYFSEISGSAKAGWSITNGIFGLICIVTIFIGWKATKGYENKEAFDNEGVSFKNIVSGPFKNKSFICVAGAFLFAIIAQTMTASVSIYYMMYDMLMTEDQISIAIASMWLFAIPWIFVLSYWSKKLSKKSAWIFASLLWIITTIVFIWFINKPGNPMSLYIMNAISIVGLNAIYQQAWAMIPDSVEVEDFKTGQRREGLYYALASFLQKLGAAIAFAISGIIITSIGYSPELIEQSAETLFGFKVLLTGSAIVFLGISILFLILSPMTRERHAALIEAIKLKKENKSYSTEAFDKLL